MPKVALVARVFLGLIFVVFGINYFVPMLPAGELSPAAGSFMAALAATGYLLPVEKTIEIAAGVLLLSGRFVPLALVLLAPIVVNIVLFHGFLDPGNLPMAVVVLGLEVFLAWSYRAAFRGLLQARAGPGTGLS